MADIDDVKVSYQPAGMVLCTAEQFALIKTLPASIAALKASGGDLDDDADALTAAVTTANNAAAKKLGKL